jgi:ComF family protein
MQLFTYINDFIHLFFPSNCYACKESLLKSEEVICTNCRLKWYVYPNISDFDPLFQHNLAEINNYKHVFAYAQFVDGGISQALLHQLKYKKAIEIGTWLGNLCGLSLFEQGFKDSFDLIIPVPIHKKRLIKRGYNQAEVIAKGVCKHLNAVLDTKSVIKFRYTVSQTKLTEQERQANTKESFKVTDGKTKYNKNILLIDDVITTGSTINTLAEEIKKFDPKSISILVVAKVGNT